MYTKVMNRGILITGNESALTSAVKTETAGRTDNFALALIPDRFSGKQLLAAGSEKLAVPPATGRAPAGGVVVTDKAVPEKGPCILEWNPGSPISARTLILSAENRLGRLNEAILICDPPAVRRPGGLAALNLADVEILVYDHIKSWFFIAKELAAVFKSRGEGILALVYPETNPRDDDTDILGSAALSSFRSLTGGLLSAAADEPYQTLGFSGLAAGDEAGFAAFIIKHIEESNRRGSRSQSGKLHKYGKLGFFR